MRREPPQFGADSDRPLHCTAIGRAFQPFPPGVGALAHRPDISNDTEWSYERNALLLVLCVPSWNGWESARLWRFCAHPSTHWTDDRMQVTCIVSVRSNNRVARCNKREKRLRLGLAASR